MIRPAIALSLVLLGCTGAATGGRTTPAGAPADPAPRLTVHADPAHAIAIDSARAALLGATESGVGIAVAVLRDGAPVWLEGIGVPGPDPAEPVDPRTTRFRIYSVAKPMTATAAARLLERGALDPDAPVQRYVPAFPPVAADGGPITTMQIATHTSGIRHYASEAEATSTRHCETVEEALPIFAGDPLVHPPGTAETYSSWGFVLLSAVVEGVAGEPFETAMRSLVFEPAGMGHVVLDDPTRPDPERATPLALAEGGRVRPAPDVDNTCKWGAGGFAASAEDVARFGAAMLDGTLLTDRSLALFLRRSDDYSARGAGVGGTALLWIDAPRRLSVALLANASGERVDQALETALDRLRAALREASPGAPDRPDAPDG